MFSDKNKRRYREKVKIDRGGCWLWDGTQDCKGYGRFYPVNWKQKTIPAHYYLFLLTNRLPKIPKGFELHHKCRRRNCVNPYHLELVTRAENMQRAKDRGAWAGSKNANSKYTEGDVMALRLLYGLGIPASWLVRAAGIKSRTLFYILDINGRGGWKHVETPTLQECQMEYNLQTGGGKELIG